MEANTKSKGEIKNLIKQELSSILLTVNPEIDKRDFKKSIKKAAKILLQGATKKRKKSIPVQLVAATEVLDIVN